MLSLSCRPLRLSFSGSGLGQGSTFVTGNLGNSDVVGLEATLRHRASDQLGFSKPNGPRSGLLACGWSRNTDSELLLQKGILLEPQGVGEREWRPPHPQWQSPLWPPSLSFLSKAILGCASPFLSRLGLAHTGDLETRPHSVEASSFLSVPGAALLWPQGSAQALGAGRSL